MNSLNQAESLLHELNIRFLRKPRKCLKVNDSLIGSSERIVYINNGTFYYYPTIQQFKDLDFDKLQYVVPKAGVKLTDILQLKFPQRSRNQRNHFSITLPKNKILKYTKTYKEMIVDQQAQGEQVWQFYFNYDIIALPQKEKRLQRVFLKQQQALENRRQQEKKQKEKEEKEKIQKLNNQYQIFMQTENVIPQQQYDKQRLQLKERQNIQKMLHQADELKFHYVYRRLIPETTIDEHLLSLQIQLLQTIGIFAQRATQEVMSFIDDLSFDQKQLKFNTFFKYQNLNFKIGDKNLNQQFLSNLYSAMAIFKLRKSSQTLRQIRVPLFAFVKYKGFKILVRSVCPTDFYDKKDLEDKIIHGNTKDTWKNNFFISESLNDITNQLNLITYNAEVHYQIVQINLGINLKVIQTPINPFEKQKQFDPSRYLENSNYKIQYLMDIDEIFPIDLDLENNIDQSTVRLRPQFVTNYVQRQTNRKTKLSGGGLMYGLDNQLGTVEDLELAKASQQLKYISLIGFIHKLDNLQLMPLSSMSLAKIMKENGINIRYIGQISKLTSLPYIRQMCMIQAIARSIKKIYRDHQKQFCLSIFRKSNQELITDAFLSSNSVGIQKIRIKQLRQIQKQVSVTNAIDFLNLIFGVSEQSQNFWSIISAKVKNQYQINIKHQTELSNGYLLMSVLYHCQFQIKIPNKLGLFLTPDPFTTKDWISFKVDTKSFIFPDMQVLKRQKKKGNLTRQQQKNQLQLSLLIARSLRKDEDHIIVQLSQFVKGIEPPKQKYTINSLKYYLLHPTIQNFQIALSICHNILPSSHPLYLQFYLTYAQIQQFDPIMLKKTAKNHSIKNLGLNHWKTSEILSAFKQRDYIENLMKAEVGVQDSRRIQLYLNIVKELSKMGKLLECTNYIKKTIKWCQQRGYKLQPSEQKLYFDILIIGMQVNYIITKLQDLLRLSESLWNALEQYGADVQYYQQLLQICMKVYMQSSTKKFFIFKIVLVICSDSANAKVTIPQKRKLLLEQLRSSCRQSKGHINWIKDMITKLQFGYTQINFLPDFFSNWKKNVQNIKSQEFQQGIRQITFFISIYGPEFFEKSLNQSIFVMPNNN